MMKLVNKVYTTAFQPGDDWLDFMAEWLKRELGPGCHPLRCHLSRVGGGTVDLEATVVEYDPGSRFASILDKIELFEPVRKTRRSSRFAVAQIIPTGIRCEYGGYAGDATPATNLLASIADFVVTHPNAVNASEINEMADNVLYVEGRSLDDFFLGHYGLQPVSSNPIGTFIDPAGEAFIDQVTHVLNAGRASAGIDCRRALVLSEPIGVEIDWTPAGCASGLIRNPEVIIEGIDALLAGGALAIGGLSVIHGVTAAMFEAHLAGKIPNPSGSVEAVITHLVSKLFRVPSAHAPLPYYADLKPPSTQNPRSSAEFISTPHYFSVLKGLHRAPRLVPLSLTGNYPFDLLTLDDIGAVVVPSSALGGIPVIAAVSSGIPVIAVRANRTILGVTAAAMGIEGVIEVENYLEAAGVIAALKSGISLESLVRPLPKLVIGKSKGHGSV